MEEFEAKSVPPHGIIEYELEPPSPQRIEEHRQRLEELRGRVPAAVALLELHAQFLWPLRLRPPQLMQLGPLFPEPLRSAVANEDSVRELLAALNAWDCFAECPMRISNWSAKAITSLMTPESLQVWRGVAVHVLLELLTEIVPEAFFEAKDRDRQNMLEDFRRLQVLSLVHRPAMLEAAPAVAAKLLYLVGIQQLEVWGVDWDVSEPWNHALELVQKTEPRDWLLEARLLAGLSILYQCEEEQRLPYLERAVELADLVKIPGEELARWLLVLGSKQEREEDLAGALDTFHRALEVANAEGDVQPEYSLTAAACLAELYEQLGDDEAARPYFERCARSPRIRHTELVSWLSPLTAAISLAHAARERKDWAEAARWYEESLRLEALDENFKGKASAMLVLHLGRMHLQQKDLEKATSTLEQAYQLTIAEHGADSPWLGDVLVARGEMCLAVEDWAGALEQYSLALAQVELHEHAESYGLAAIHYHLGLILLHLLPTEQRRSDAKAHLLEAQRLYNNQERPPQPVMEQIADALADLQY